MRVFVRVIYSSYDSLEKEGCYGNFKLTYSSNEFNNGSIGISNLADPKEQFGYQENQS